MIGEQEQKKDGFVGVSCKVPIWVAELLNIIAAARGINVNTLLHRCIDFLIETAKVDGPVPPEMMTLIHMLKMSADWNKAFDFASITNTTEVAQVILILQQNDGKEAKQGFGMVMIDKPYATDTEPVMTTCVDHILERCAEVSMGELYKELRQAGVTLGTNSLRETLTAMCDAQLIEHLREEDAAELPALGNFHDFGKVIEYGNKHKRVAHRTPDSIAKQTTIQFDDIDRDTADMEVQDWEGEHRQHEEPPEDMENEFGFRPHGQEW